MESLYGGPWAPATSELSREGKCRNITKNKKLVYPVTKSGKICWASPHPSNAPEYRLELWGHGADLEKGLERAGFPSVSKRHPRREETNGEKNNRWGRKERKRRRKALTKGKTDKANGRVFGRPNRVCFRTRERTQTDRTGVPREGPALELDETNLNEMR